MLAGIPTQRCMRNFYWAILRSYCSFHEHNTVKIFVVPIRPLIKSFWMDFGMCSMYYADDYGESRIFIKFCLDKQFF